MTDLFTDTDRGAVFSPCRSWRYTLWRRWSEAPALNFLMLNPSTADETENDPTVERCERRARAGGYGGLVVTNAYALRSTDPRGLWTASDPVGPDNDDAIGHEAAVAGAVVCGWGRHCTTERAQRVRALIRKAGKAPLVLVVNKDGSPKHPLYVAYDVQPKAWSS